jgi:hypothetical protein
VSVGLEFEIVLENWLAFAYMVGDITKSRLKVNKVVQYQPEG